MGKFLKTLLGLVPHVLIVLSVMMITFVVTDYFNRSMAFVNNGITKGLMVVMAALAIVESVYVIYRMRKDMR